jgi:hypothetical protein
MLIYLHNNTFLLLMVYTMILMPPENQVETHHPLETILNINYQKILMIMIYHFHSPLIF